MIPGINIFQFKVTVHAMLRAHMITAAVIIMGIRIIKQNKYKLEYIITQCRGPRSYDTVTI